MISKSFSQLAYMRQDIVRKVRHMHAIQQRERQREECRERERGVMLVNVKLNKLFISAWNDEIKTFIQRKKRYVEKERNQKNKAGYTQTTRSVWALETLELLQVIVNGTFFINFDQFCAIFVYTIALNRKMTSIMPQYGTSWYICN